LVVAKKAEFIGKMKLGTPLAGSAQVTTPPCAAGGRRGVGRAVGIAFCEGLELGGLFETEHPPSTNAGATAARRQRAMRL
jgi:hypothetical protein